MGRNPRFEAIHLPWPMTLESLKRAIAESRRHGSDNDRRPVSPPPALTKC